MEGGANRRYQDFLDGLRANRWDAEVRSFFKWVGEDFDPERFDRHAANAALSRMAWNQWGTK